jgi:hypothetical protein
MTSLNHWHLSNLQAALNTRKPFCAGISNYYSCGNHDVLPQYTGNLVPVGVGDEIAMNSVVLSVVRIDGEGC